jgi:hypothetical protein
MSVNSVFVKAEWLSAGKKWGTIPPHVKHVGKQEFLIPNFIRAEVLPLSGISIKDVLEFSLPTPTTPVQTIDPASFFSRTVPNPVSKTLLARLRRLPTPPKFVVDRLIELGYQVWLDGYQSVRYIHLSDTVTTHFPLWVVSFWAAVLDIRQTVRKPWAEAKEWLNAETRMVKSIERQQLAEDAKVFLAALPWDSLPVCNLWRFLGPHWTTGSQQSDLLDDLSDRIMAQPDLAEKLCVKGLALSAKIIEAAASQDTDLYRTAQTFRWIRQLGDDIVLHKRSSLTLHNLGEDNQHWVALVIDGETQTIWYGNSYGTDIAPELVDAYQWWLLQHTSSPFMLAILPITFQELYNTSLCSFLSHNSLEHFAFPDTVPLIASSGI